MGIGSFFPFSFLFQTQTEERQSEARFGDFDEDNEARRRFRRRTRSKQTHTRVLNIWTKNDFDEEQDRSKPTLDLYVGWNMSLDNETGLDPPGVRGRPVTGLVAADYFAPGYFAWAVLIANLARIGYEEKNMYMAAYDWRLSFQNTEVCDQTLSRIISNIELLVATNGGHKAVIIPHSMGVLYFLRFMKWVEAPAPMGGGGGPDWCAKHIKAVMNIGDDCEW